MTIRQRVMGMVAVLTLGLAGCNTFAGAGKDIERGGEVVQEAARDVQSKF